jgi:hypothetical protein
MKILHQKVKGADSADEVVGLTEDDKLAQVGHLAVT